MQVLYPDRIGIWRYWVLQREENQRTQRSWRKILKATQEPTTNSTRVWHGASFKPRPHCWESSVFTTAPSLLSCISLGTKGKPARHKIKRSLVAYRHSTAVMLRNILAWEINVIFSLDHDNYLQSPSVSLTHF